MENASLWLKLSETYGTPKSFWETTESSQSPSVTDRIVYYLISYFDAPSTARKAVRRFLGIDKINDSSEYCDWNEVRVATLRELQETLESVGCRTDSWELAVTLKDFLQNAFDTLETVHLDDAQEDFTPQEIVSYFKQLRGFPGAWFKTENKGIPGSSSSPYRPDTSPFYKQCKRYRKEGEPVLPENAIQYLEYLWGRTTRPPFDFHANKVLSRMGVFSNQEEMSSKVSKFHSLVGEERPINKHRHLVQFSKTICTTEPRCQICPLTDGCQFYKNKLQSVNNLAKSEIGDQI